MKAQQFSYRIYPFVAVILLLSVNAFFVADSADAQTQSLVADTSLSECHNLIVYADSIHSLPYHEQEAYDGYRAYMESCAYLSNSWTTFSDIGATNSDRNNDPYRNSEYREWLKKVLYYNLDTNYYCSDVSELLSTFSWFNDSRGRDIRGALSVLYFLVESNKCRKATAYYDTVSIPATWRALHNIWQDTVRDPPAAPFDSTLPTLEDLDLGILRGPNSGIVAFNNAVIGPVISNLRALENPFTSETTIAFDCREAVALKFEVYDILGKKVYDGGSHIYDRGANKLVLSGEILASGILYARFSNPNGFVSTLKLRHR